MASQPSWDRRQEMASPQIELLGLLWRLYILLSSWKLLLGKGGPG